MPLMELFSVASIGNSDQGVAPPVRLLLFSGITEIPPLWITKSCHSLVARRSWPITPYSTTYVRVLRSATYGGAKEGGVMN
jgi:hypothetical protein